MSLSQLHSGKYIIRNLQWKTAVGLPPTLPTILPVISVKTPGIEPIVWDVEHIKDSLYRLKCNNFAAVPEGKLVFGILDDNKGFEWDIKQRAPELNEYTIMFPIPDTPDGWTLLSPEDNTQVALRLVVATKSLPPHINPEQLWEFEPVKHT